MSWPTFLLLVGAGGSIAFLLACAVSLAYWRGGEPVRCGFEVRYEHLPQRRHHDR